MSSELTAGILTVSNEVGLKWEKHNVWLFLIHLEGTISTGIKSALLQDASVADVKKKKKDPSPTAGGLNH